MEMPLARLKSRVRNNSNSGRNNQLMNRNSTISTRNNVNNLNNGKNRLAGVTGTGRSNSFKNNNNHQRHLNPLFKNLRNNNCGSINNAAGGNNHSSSNNNSSVNNNGVENNSIQTITKSNVIIYENNKNLNNGNNNTDGNTFKKTAASVCAGKFTREVYNAICPRLGHNTLHIPEDSLQAVFNDIHLYPTNSQVSEMLQCARQCSRRNGASSPYITFGEFCVFAREMQNQHKKTHRKLQTCKQNNTNKCTSKCEVFLGGSCNPTTWRADTAIPELQKYGITFYNPQVSMWVPELVAQEHDAKQAASVLLFVVDSQTRSTVGMIEVAFLVASGRCVVLVAQPYRPNQSIMGETITHREYRDLVEGQMTLLMLVKTKGIRVHESLPSALQCVASTIRNSTNIDITAEALLTNKLRKLREVFDSYGGQKGEITVLEFLKAFRDLTQREITPTELFDYSTNNENITNITITFDRFCVLMAEFTTDNCDMCTTNGWISQSFQRQYSPNNNTCNFDNAHIISTNNSVNNTNSKQKKYDVFLGGTRNACNDWRREFAIPILEKHGVTYYNPTVRETMPTNNVILDNFCVNDNTTSDQDILKWKQAMDNSAVLLFVITNDTRSLTSMILAAHYLGSGKDMVLFIEQLPDEGSVVCNETLSSQAVKDYNRGRVYVADMAKRKQIPVFDNITEAIQCVVGKCQNR